MCASAARCSGSAGELPDPDARARADARQQASKRLAGGGNAAGGRREARPRHVPENAGAAVAHDRPVVEADLDDDVVKPVRAHEPFLRAGRCGAAANQPVVGAVLGKIAPPVAAADRAQGQPGGRAANPVRAIVSLP
jgi:hypothetical protein